MTPNAGVAAEVDESTLLPALRAGDERAFQRLTDRYRRELLVHCYRMLGSYQDAEDVLQETLLRAWRGLESFEGRSSRAATLTASPVTTFWSEAAITSPVLTPTRMARLTPCCALNSVFSSVSRSSIWQADRSARSASSSRTIGTPKVAMTESPMNFWTAPPQASIVEVMTE